MSTVNPAIDWKAFPTNDLAVGHGVLVLLLKNLRGKWPGPLNEQCPDAYLRQKIASKAHKEDLLKLPMAARPYVPAPSAVPCTFACIYCQSNRTHLSNLKVVYQRIKLASSTQMEDILTNIREEHIRRGANFYAGRTLEDAIAQERERYGPLVDFDAYYAAQLLFVRNAIDVLPDWQREMMISYPLDELFKHTVDEIIRRGLD
jgi:hypothetical protein